MRHITKATFLMQPHCLPEGNAVDLGSSVGVVLLVPGLRSFT